MTTATTSTVKPAAPANGRGQGPRASRPLETFRAAAAVVNSGDVRGGAGVSLKAATLALYVEHAAHQARNINGHRMLDSEGRKAVTLRMWESLGYGEAPKADTRKPADKSVAQYVARFGTVAASLDTMYGIGALNTIKSADSAYKAISDYKSAHKADAAHTAYVAWKNTLPTVEADALSLVFDVLTRTTGRGGKAHAAEFAVADPRREQQQVAPRHVAGPSVRNAPRPCGAPAPINRNGDSHAPPLAGGAALCCFQKLFARPFFARPFFDSTVSLKGERA
jgi:hypothetical protein